MTVATPLYRGIMVELERRRLQLGLTNEMVNDLAGVQDGYLAKMVWADTPSGRQAGWEMVQLVVDALFPSGFDVVLKPSKSGSTSALKQRIQLRFARALVDGRHQRELMRELGAKGGKAKRRKLPIWKRKSIARKAASARWRKPRVVEITSGGRQP